VPFPKPAMTRRRWIADEVSDSHAALVGDHADHLVRVLRAHVGQEFDIVASGVVRRGRVTGIAENRVDFELGEEVQSSVAPSLTLVLAIFKFDRMEWAIEKCTELGVSKILPLIAGRTDTHLAAASTKRVERWRRISIQAAEQSRRSGPPEIFDPVKLRDALNLPGETRIVLSEVEQENRLRDSIVPRVNADTILAIGPEGGWTEDELELFAQNGWISSTLGPTILRAETAAIAATTLAVSILNE
jgi:16S rRNA (uracil1498-N3)-methyltransferase